MAAANRIVILYATRQGQTAKIAAYIADALRKRRFDVELFNVGMLSVDFNLGRYSAAILASSVNYGRHQPELMDYVKEHGGELQDMNTVFLSVSGAQAGAEDVAVSESGSEGLGGTSPDGNRELHKADGLAPRSNHAGRRSDDVPGVQLVLQVHDWIDGSFVRQQDRYDAKHGVHELGRDR